MNIATSPHAIPLNPDDLRRIAAIVREIAGIELPTSKTNLIQARLAKRLRSTGARDFGAYCDIIENPGAKEERAELLSAVTTNVTRFFRENHHFEHMAKTALPALEKRAEMGYPIRIWSAASSTGEEAYSIAMTILRVWPKAKNWNIKITATDIDPTVIKRANTGEYALPKPYDPPLAKHAVFFDAIDDGSRIRVKDFVKKMVSFSVLNLHSTWPKAGDYDIIFCRNVAIYFDQSRQKRLWQNFSKVLRPNGVLYIGHSERIEGNERLGLKLSGVTTYEKTNTAGGGSVA